MKIKFASVISLLMATALLVGVLFTSCSEKKQAPEFEAYLDKIIETTFAGVNNKEPQVTTSKLTFKDTFEIPYLNSFEATVITGKSGETASLLNAKLETGDISASSYVAGTSCIITSNIFGDDVKYGLDISDAEKVLDLFGSFIAPDGFEDDETFEDDEMIEDDEMDASSMLGMISGLTSLLDGNNTDEMAKLVEKYAKVVANAAKSTVNGKVDTGDKITVTLEFNTDSAKKLIKDVFAEAKKDAELKNLLSSMLVTSGVPQNEAAVQINSMLSNESLNSIYDALDSTPFTIVTVITANNNYVLNGYSFTIESEGQSLKLFYTDNENGKLEIGYSMSMTEGTVTVKQEQSVVFATKTENGAEIYTADLVTVSEGSAYSVPLMRYEIKDGGYKLTVYSDVEGEQIGTTLAGMTKTEGAKTVTTITSATAYGETIPVDVTLETEIGTTLPTFPTEYKNITELTEDDFDELAENVMNSPIGALIPQNEKIPENEVVFDSDVMLPDVDY